MPRDYYSVLQVHPDAEPEVVQSAYKRLCKKYHPDINPSPFAAEKIKEINEAYEVLSDPRQSREYRAEWQRTARFAAPKVEYREKVVYVNRPAPAPPPPPAPKKDMGTEAANKCLIDYLNALSAKDYRKAYSLISETDRGCFTLASFEEWQKSVSDLYKIEKFGVSLFKRHGEYRIDAEKNLPAEEFKVSVAERELRTRNINEYSFSKIVVTENDNWRVYLGYRDLTPLLVQFKTQANTQEEYLLRTHWDSYKQTHAINMGLPNRAGFDEYAAGEAYRHRRYARPFSIAVFRVNLPARAAAMKEKALKYAGYIISRDIRPVDRAAWLGDDLFGLVLAETDEKNARRAGRRLIKTVRRDVAVCFDFEADVKIGVTTYKGLSMDEMIGECLKTIDASGTGTRTKRASAQSAV